jgi:hypothetical protein
MATSPGELALCVETIVAGLNSFDPAVLETCWKLKLVKVVPCH